MLNLHSFGVRLEKVGTLEEPNYGSYMLRYFNAENPLDARERAMRHFGNAFRVIETWLYRNECFGLGD